MLKDQFGPQPALQDFEAALQLRPGDYWALLGIGHVYLYDLKDLDRAEEYYRQALGSDEKIPNAYYYLGEVRLARGDGQAAAQWYRLALARQADFQPAIDRLSKLTSP